MFKENVIDFKQQTLFKEHLEEISDQIAQLEEAKKNVKSSHPLVWGIEFAEIFGDKGGFDIVIGNPPYVRQEKIGDPLGRVDAKNYKDYLEKLVRADFPEYFGKDSKIDGKSDLYSYFYIRGLRLLNEGGINTYICSNSWLDAGYGVWLQKFILEHARLSFIIDNHAERSFAAADVNTIISVIHAPRPQMTGEHDVRFVALKEPFEKVIFTENLLQIEHTDAIISNDVFRVYPIKSAELLENGTEYANDEQKKIMAGKYCGDKWGGRYLRAPEIFFLILSKGKDLLARPSKYFTGERYLNTGGADGFYIPTGKAPEPTAGSQIATFSSRSRIVRVSSSENSPSFCFSSNSSPLPPSRKKRW